MQTECTFVLREMYKSTLKEEKLDLIILNVRLVSVPFDKHVISKNSKKTRMLREGRFHF